MKRTTILIAMTAILLAGSDAFGDHFERQRREAAARREFDQPTYRAGHWGGPTTQGRWYPSHDTFRRQDVLFAPTWSTGYPSFGYGRWNPYYGYGIPYYGLPVGQQIYIHREIIRGP